MTTASLSLRSGVSPMVIRRENARTRLVTCLTALADITAEEARKVAAHYLKIRVAKLDAVTGQFTVKHGAFLDKDTILRAVALAK